MNALLSMIEQFHFIRTEWLWGVPATILLWLLLRRQADQQQWSNYIPKAMLAALQISSNTQTTQWKWCLLLVYITAVIAAAGPTWYKQPAPTVQNQKGLVIALDLSPSMLAQDLSPDRLTRAKYKLIDILRRYADGQAALLAYAGDAHTVSPLSDDPKTIEALLPALHPNVMPSRGSNTEAAITLAQQLMKDAGLSSGDILLISDGVASDAINTIRNSMDPSFRLSILAVGGRDAAPIPAPNGGFVRNADGEIVLSAVNASELRAMATSLGGRFSTLSADDSDIDTLLVDQFDAKDSEQSQLGSVVYDAWVDMGHWLIILALPLALLLFRKGVIYLLPLGASLALIAPQDSYASEFTWKDLWQTKNQQAAKQYQAGEYDNAAKTFQREDWSAVAHYKNGSYEQAIKQLENNGDVRSLYNKGNAYAFNGQLEEALEAYTEVLEQQADHQDAAHNKAVIEQLLQQQQNQQNQQQNQDSENSQDSQSENNPSQDQKQQASDSQSPNNQSEEQQSNEQQSEQQNQQAQNSNSEQSQSENQSAQPEPDIDSEDTEQTDAKEEQSNQADEPEDNAIEQESDPETGAAQLEQTDQPLKDSSEQWLRTIQDDPSGLLRRKFDYQARQRAQQRDQRATERSAKERY